MALAATTTRSKPACLACAARRSLAATTPMRRRIAITSPGNASKSVSRAAPLPRASHAGPSSARSAASARGGGDTGTRS